MDALSQLLAFSAPQGSIDKNCLLSAGWSLPHAAGSLATIRWHTVTQGAAWLELPSGETFTLLPGQVIVLTQNSAHRLRQKGPGETWVVCGSLQLSSASRHFLTALPEALRMAPEQGSPEHTWLLAAVALLQQEADKPQAGMAAVCSQQCATMIALGLRQWLRTHAQDKSQLSLLLHPRLSAAVQSMLNAPQMPWTVASLAEQVHMSRASFALLFREVSGTTPLAVLTRIRLQISAQQLSREASSVIAIADAVGYASESSFHKAFMREFGCTPGEYRKRVRALETE
ncbi:reactive chlorine-specific transcriptional regulator RclR [Cedecea neteri]|uniref:reactive chlorine-specific transcriptional regulator RclR n=1 Tax=Cedecea neteri TaxID=158822 RepID=UPI002AA84AD8|nr:reactive chlorine-specific transcriptional regulator RclR [Cedecea neteri]WPU22702.1 reactive chlorine-specific transcriptional regulator RclR [Cedecea neteri]